MDFENYLKLFSLRKYIQNFEYKNITVSDLFFVLKREIKEYFEDISVNNGTPLVLKIDYYLEKRCAYDALKMITTDYANEDFVLDLDLDNFGKILDGCIIFFNEILTDDFLKFYE